MKVTGIIAEYNPFHSGHQYHIEETKKRTKADYIVAVMSGNFVQRGAPAILNKYERTRMALENGIDLVIELPIAAALSSAEGFAMGGVCLLHKLGVVTDISFGAEISSVADTDTLRLAAELFASEPADFQSLLSSFLKQGYNFPSARMMAARAYLKVHHPAGREISALLSSPNNILAIEYLKAIKRYRCSLCPCIIPREGNGYHDQNLGNGFASASAIRNALLDNSSILFTERTAPPDNGSTLFAEKTVSPDNDSILFTEKAAPLAEMVPASVYQTLYRSSSENEFLQEDDFSDMLFYALSEHASALGNFGFPNTDFSLRVKHTLEQFETWTQFAGKLKTKNQTYTAISRYLAQVLLGITREHMALAGEFQYAPYARILGFHKSAAPLLKAICRESRIPVITRLAKQQDSLSSNQNLLLDLDIHASDLYNRMLFTKSGKKILSDYRQPLITTFLPLSE